MTTAVAHRMTMSLSRSLSSLLVLSFRLGLNAFAATPSAFSTCQDLSEWLSSASAVFFEGSDNYALDNQHFSIASSGQSACAVEPGSTEDVSKLIQVIGERRLSFGIKSGGHATNPGFSSTDGVLIAMRRFNRTLFDTRSGTVTIGTGLTWDQVYNALEPHGVTVVGGRVARVGVGGFVLGGGYSWLSQEHGLTIDNVLSLQLVLPNGQTVLVDPEKQPDLFFALRGSWNNFGIVTEVTMRAIPIGKVFGGSLSFGPDQLEQVRDATARFVAGSKNPKAQILSVFGFFNGSSIASISLFYNGPTAPSGTFDDFLNITAASKDISTRNYTSLVISASGPSLEGVSRVLFDTVPVKSYSPSLIDQYINQSKVVGEVTFKRSGLQGTTFYAIEPFLPTVRDHAVPAAYPHSSGPFLRPSNPVVGWAQAADDGLITRAFEASSQAIYNQALREGLVVKGPDNILYGNYALSASTKDPRQIWGDNLARLIALKRRYDPKNVMGLAGGWKIPLKDP